MTNKRVEQPLPILIMNESLPILIVALYCVIGFVANAWHPGWIIFFAIPLYYMTVACVRYKNPYIFPYPILAVVAFLLCGTIWGLWHPAWVVFVTIPLYYAIVSLIKNGTTYKLLHAVVPLIIVAIYLLIGFFANAWHPGWIIFFLIPIYEQICAVVRRYKRTRNH